MARGHGRILTSIWEDAEFLMLDQGRQRLYLFLISQPNLNHAGLLPLTLRRWARKAFGLTASELDEHLVALDAARFIVMDEDTEELLIRSFVRNDGVWKQPKVMGAMVSGAQEISSRKLRLALLAEMDRIPLDDLSDEPTKVRNVSGPSIRQQVSEHIAALRKAFEGLDPTPPASTVEGGSAGPSVPPLAAPSDTPGEGGREASTHADAWARPRPQAQAAPAPVPCPSPLSPAPAPEERGVAGAVTTSAAVAVAQQQPDGLSPIPDDFRINDTMRRWIRATFPNLDPEFETEQFVAYWRSEGRRKANWPEAWTKWVRDSNKRDYERTNRQTGGASVLPFQAPQRPATSDTRAQQAMEAGRRVQALADAKRAQETS
jgi:hypothetical protein